MADSPIHPATAWHQKDTQRPRWLLHVQAVIWRLLMRIGMLLHKLAPPRPPKPDFTRHIHSTIATHAGSIPLQFYVPEDYFSQRRLYQRRSLDLARNLTQDTAEDVQPRRLSQTLSAVGQAIRRRTSLSKRWGAYPVVINFHGGGFTLGTATDDARWCATVVEECHAVVISVDYRLAPEYPFPTAVEDGADAVLWVHEHATELGVDPDNIALSGFSSGANMAVSVPLRLHDELNGFPHRNSQSRPSTSHQTPMVPDATMRNPDDSAPSAAYRPHKDDTVVQIGACLSSVRIRCIIPWYPSLDYTRTREERRATCVRKDQELPAIFTDLFDESYLHPPQNISLDSPYLSPGVAPTELIREALPQDIILRTCEWDMLLDEGIAFKDRLISLGKTVHYKMVEGVPHGWDKAPNPLKPTPGVREHYLGACKQMRLVFSSSSNFDMPEERQTEAGPSAAPRGSVSVVR